jgi:hypothetical protein
MGETWRVPSKDSGGLCVNLWSCGYMPTLDHVSLLNELIVGWELGSTHIVNRMLKLMKNKCRMLSAQSC